MAKCTLQGFGEAERALSRLAHLHGSGIRAVKKAAPIVERAMKQKISDVTNRTDRRGRRYATGQLAESVMATNAAENQYGAYSVVKVTGHNKRHGKGGLDNETEFRYLEYGARHGGVMQEARPVRTPVINSTRDEVQRVMEDVIMDEIDRGFEK